MVAHLRKQSYETRGGQSKPNKYVGGCISHLSVAVIKYLDQIKLVMEEFILVYTSMMVEWRYRSKWYGWFQEG